MYVTLIHPIKDPTGRTVSKIKDSVDVELLVDDRGIVLRYKTEPEFERLEPWSNVLEVTRGRPETKGKK